MLEKFLADTKQRYLCSMLHTMFVKLWIFYRVQHSCFYRCIMPVTRYCFRKLYRVNRKSSKELKLENQMLDLPYYKHDKHFCLKLKRVTYNHFLILPSASFRKIWTNLEKGSKMLILGAKLLHKPPIKENKNFP